MVSFLIQGLRPGEIYRERRLVSLEVPHVSWRVSYLQLTDQRLILSCARVSNIFVLPLFPITFFTFLFYGFGAAIIPGVTFLCLVLGYPLKFKSAFNLCDIASCRYQKSDDLFRKDTITIYGRDSISWRIANGGRQRSAGDVVKLLGKAGVNVIGAPEGSGWFPF